MCQNTCTDFTVTVTDHVVPYGEEASIDCQFTCGDECSHVEWYRSDKADIAYFHDLTGTTEDQSSKDEDFKGRLTVAVNGNHITLLINPTVWEDDTQWKCRVVKNSCTSQQFVEDTGQLVLLGKKYFSIKASR